MLDLENKAIANLPTKYGEFKIFVYRDKENNQEAIAFIFGDLSNKNNKPVHVRVHSECLTGDVFGSLKCDCGFQLDKALKMISSNGLGILIYLKQEGRGIGLFNKIKAYGLQDLGQDTIEANHSLGFETDLRNYNYAVEILNDLKINKIHLLTNNPDKINQLKNNGINVIQQVSIIEGINDKNIDYLKVKKEKMNHIFNKELDDDK